MVQYICEKCQKVFNLKGDYSRHIKRKISCVENQDTIENENIIEKLNILIKTNEELTKKVNSMEHEMVQLKQNNNTVKVNGDVNINYQVNIVAHGKENLSY